ncbi:40S ribosomal protein S10 [Exaiptasia diaphana]|uniref:Uncharacterized protein n=1 Tax=Exaiptasia diaphana TaxID=2652724 RepID=A0A913WVH6_EXADI|nr:40S ribosomal protein S10 [Exaiptasia diaphana]
MQIIKLFKFNEYTFIFTLTLFSILGITYLRDYLHLPPEIVPSTLRRQTTRAETARPRPKGMDSGPRGPDSSDRDTYRRGPPGGDPKGGAGTDFKPEFRGGYGRGRPGGGFGAPPPQ